MKLSLSPPYLPSGAVLKTSLSVALALLSSLLISAFGQQSLDAWQAHERAGDIRSFDRAANQFVAGVLELQKERLYTNNALQAPSQAGTATLREIAFRRQQVRQDFDSGLAILRQIDFPDRDALLSQLTLALARADELRGLADRNIVLPRERRQEEVRRDFVPVITAAVDASRDLWLAALHEEAAFDSALAYLAIIKEIAVRLHEAAAQEHSHIAAAIAASAPLSPEQRAGGAIFRTQVNLLWSQLESLAAGPGNHSEIRAAMTRSRQIYFTQFRELADKLIEDNEENPIFFRADAGRWVERTTPQIGVLLDILHAAARTSELHTTSVHKETRDTLVTSLSLLALGLVTAAGTLTLALYLVTLLTRRALAQEELTHQAERAMAEAEKANRGKSLFLANMSHELRTPLNAILGFADLIARHLRQSGAPRTYIGYADDVLTSSQVLLDLINDVLDFARVESKSLRLQDDVVDVAALMNWSLRIIGSAHPNSGLSITADIEPDLPLLAADERRIKQIIMNLLSNAVKFTPVPGSVRASVRLAGDSITLSVQDTGIGMTETEIELALQPFQQVHSGLARKYSGAGLGLPLVKALAHLHGAALEIDSQPTKGTCVQVIFPPERTRRPACMALEHKFHAAALV